MRGRKREVVPSGTQYEVRQRPGDTAIQEDPIRVRGKAQAELIARSLNLAYRAGYIDCASRPPRRPGIRPAAPGGSPGCL